MDRAASTMSPVAPVESLRPRMATAPVVLALEVSDPDVLSELRRHPEGVERDKHALAALRVGVIALRAATGQVDAASIREAGRVLVADVRDLLSTRTTEMHERIAMDANGARAQLTSTIEAALAEQRKQILREFSLDRRESALSRLVAEFSLDDEQSAMSRLSKMVTVTTAEIGKHLTLDDEHSPLARLKRELQFTIDRLVRDNVEFQSQVRESLARIDSRRRVEARAPSHGLEFEDRLGEVLAGEAQRVGDIYHATGDSTGRIKNCKVGDYVVELGADCAAANARVVWEAKAKRRCSLRAALDEIDEARRNRQAQVGVFVFASANAPAGLASLQRHAMDIVVVWDPDDPGGDLVVRVAYSLARALAVRERCEDRSTRAVIGEIESAARAIEKQQGYLDDVRKWAETVKGHGEKIADRSARMAEELQRDVERLDGQIAAMRATGP
jgi:hypothetical protein